MKKIIFALLLTAVSTSVMAEWTLVRVTDQLTAYIDSSSIRKVGNKVKIWDMLDFQSEPDEQINVPKNLQVKFLSIKARSQYDCKAETRQTLNVVWYSGNMGRGKVVLQSSASELEKNGFPTKIELIIPDTVGEDIWKIACGKQ